MVVRLVLLVAVLLVAGPPAAAKGKCRPWMMTEARERSDVAFQGVAIYNSGEGAGARWGFRVERYLRGSGPHEVTVSRLPSSLSNTPSWAGLPSEIATGESWHIYGTRDSPTAPENVKALFCSGSHPASHADPFVEARWRQLSPLLVLIGLVGLPIASSMLRGIRGRRRRRWPLLGHPPHTGPWRPLGDRRSS